MKNVFRKKMTFAWKTGVFFVLFAALWHLPLLLTPSPKHANRPLRKISENEHYLVFQMPQHSMGYRFSWDDPTVYLLPTATGFSNYLQQPQVLPALFSESASSPPEIIQPFSWSHIRMEVDNQDVPTMMQMTLSDEKDGPSEISTNSKITVEDGSAWRITGSIAERRASATAALPTIFSPEPLAATVLRIGVTPLGDVQFVALEQSSGLDKADEAAIRFAKGIHLSPLDASPDDVLAWGFVKIFWRAESEHT